VGLKLNETHQLLTYVDDENLLWDNIDTIKKKTNSLFDASKCISLEVRVEKTKCIVCYHDATAVLLLPKFGVKSSHIFMLSP
jgi:hypothetical protein